MSVFDTSTFLLSACSDGIAEDVGFYGNILRKRVMNKFGFLFPKISPKNSDDKLDIISLIWARTIPSPDPFFKDSHVPLISSYILSSQKNKNVLSPIVDKEKRTIKFEIVKEFDVGNIDEYKNGNKLKRGAYFKCLYSGALISPNI